MRHAGLSHDSFDRALSHEVSPVPVETTAYIDHLVSGLVVGRDFGLEDIYTMYSRPKSPSPA
jgi:hypothetical protein